MLKNLLKLLEAAKKLKIFQKIEFLSNIFAVF